MGRLINPPPVESGNDCPACTPGLWPVGKTPMYMFAYFSGISNCGKSSNYAPNGYTFLLQQDPLNACLWKHDGDVWFVDYRPWLFGPDRCQVRLYDQHGWFFFVGTNVHCSPEIIRFTNAQAACILMYAGAGGVCLLDWSGILHYLIAELGIETKPKLMKESRSIDADSQVVKLCSLYQRTNVRFKIEI